MINKSSLFILVLSGVLLTECTKKFLDVPVQGQGTTATDPSLAQNLVVGVYNSLLNGEAFGGNDIHGFAFISATNIMSDDADKGSTPPDQASTAGEMDDFTITPTNVFVSSLWSGYYNGIARCNQAIAALNIASLDTATKNELIGEVRFIRGYYYFNLVRFFGAVPKVLRVPQSAQDANTDNAFQTRAPVDTIYNSVIIPDLEYAMSHLPIKAKAAIGHATKGAAESMLAKVYMYRKNWQQVFDLTQDVINSGQYTLVPDYSTIWRQVGDNNAESIFEVETGQFNNSDYGVQLYSECQGPRVGGKGGWADLGWGFCTPSVNLINAYEPGDKREAATIIFIDNSGTHVGTYLFDGFRIPSSDSVQNLYYNYKAYHSENKNVESWFGNRDFKEKNIHILRYAEVLLMNAEAANELNQTSIAIANLNMVRSRAGLPPTTASSQSDLRNAIWKERRVELALEHDRFWDLVRQGRAAQVMQAAGKAFVANKNELLPIPSVQILLSGNKLTQNPGY
jgi:starch-binding outer membrane protein, SusD/RagB family